MIPASTESDIDSCLIIFLKSTLPASPLVLKVIYPCHMSYLRVKNLVNIPTLLSVHITICAWAECLYTNNLNFKIMFKITLNKPKA